jgi:hypothetical protein
MGRAPLPSPSCLAAHAAAAGAAAAAADVLAGVLLGMLLDRPAPSPFTAQQETYHLSNLHTHCLVQGQGRTE